MIVIGEEVTVLDARDHSVIGKEGRILLETAKTVLLGSGSRTIVIGKEGSTFRLGSGKVFSGHDIAGRLQDRLGRRSS